MLVSTAIACRLTQRQLSTRVLSTSASRSENAKTPVQEWGWEYLQRQKALGRPISPHLTVYQPQLTWMLSGFHRISGCMMAGTLLFGGVGFALLPIDFTTFVEFIRGLGLPSVITSAFKFVVAFPIIFHTLNGIRFIGFDLAKGVDNIGQVYKSGYLVFGLAFLLALAVTINAIPSKKQNQQQ